MRVHGTVSSYTGGCRCEPCRGANSDYMKAWRQRKALESAGLRAPTRKVTDLTIQSLDAAVTRVGQEFPAIGALVRLGWTATA